MDCTDCIYYGKHCSPNSAEIGRTGCKGFMSFETHAEAVNELGPDYVHLQFTDTEDVKQEPGFLGSEA